MSSPVLATPTDAVTATYLAGNLMTVSWPAMTGATSYVFQLNSVGVSVTPTPPVYDNAIVAPAKQLDEVVPSSSTSTTASFSGLNPSFKYSLLVTGVNSSGATSFPVLTVITPSSNSTYPNQSAPTGGNKAKSTTIRYRKVVCWGLSPSAINFAQAGYMGHRVAISLPVDLMNKFFSWTRASGEVAPTGRFSNNPPGTVLGTDDFTSELVKAFGNPYNDMDGVSNGLNFSSSALDIAGDLKRDPSVYNVASDTGAPAGSAAGAVPTGVSTTHYGANDLVMAYLMYKCFGSSAYDPTDIIYNVDDAFNMLTSEQLAQSIADSLAAEDAMANAAVQPNGKPVDQQLPGDNKGQVDAMFRGFLAADPMRYFLGGVQIPGLFETNFSSAPGDPSVGGNWCLTVGDKIEVPLQLVFRAPVSVLSVQDNVQNPSSATPDSANTQYIAGEAATFDCNTQKANPANVVSIRLQISCASPVGAGTGSSSSPSGAVIPLTVAPAPSVVFYTPESYGLQQAQVVSVAGGVGPYIYSIDIAAVALGFPLGSAIGEVNLDSATGKLSFTAPKAYAGIYGKWSIPVVITDSTPSTPAVEKVWVNISIDNGNGASNSSIYMTGQTANAGVNTYLDVLATPTTPAMTVYNPLYPANPQGLTTISHGRTLTYASPEFAVSAALSAVPAALLTDPILKKPLSYDLLTFTYLPPTVKSIAGQAPLKLAKEVTWSIKSAGGKSGNEALPKGMQFNSGKVVLSADGVESSAFLEINLDKDSVPVIPAAVSTGTDTPAAWTIPLAGADYSVGNKDTAGNSNVPGRHEFLVTATDDNGFSQSFPVSINIAIPPATAAITPLAAVSQAASATGLSYVNGNTLSYAASAAADPILLTNSSKVVDSTGALVADTTGNFKWTLSPVNPAMKLPEANIGLVQGATDKNTATLTITPTGASAGVYPYLVTSLDSRNVQQTVFYTINIA